MKKIFILLCLFVFVSCKNANKQNDSNISNSKVDSFIVFADTATILGERFTVLYKNNDTLYVHNQKNDVIAKIPNLHPNFKFADFNGDSLKDIVVTSLGNVPEVQNVLVFDKINKKFTLVEGLSDFPASKLIKGTKYYYSYSRRGCNDMNWDSYLFYIEENVVNPVGFIDGTGCKNNEKEGIRISKIQDTKKSLISEIPISVIEKYQNQKFGFIEKYWTNNYSEFANLTKP